MHENNILTVKNLSKIFYQKKFPFLRMGKRRVHKIFDNVSFNLYQGEILGVIGPNGAGKTTLLKIISGQLKPTSGEVAVSSHVNDLKKNTTIITSGGWIGLSVFATVEENLFFFAKASGLPDDILKRNVENALKSFGLIKYRKEFPTILSSGFRQRLLLARALLLMTPILILDEPTSNVDFYTKINFYNLLLENVKKSKQSVIISTHKLSEIDQICDRFLFIKDKKIYIQDRNELINHKIAKYFMKVKSVSPNFLDTLQNDKSISDFIRLDKDQFIISSHLTAEVFLKKTTFLSNIIEFRIIKKSLFDIYKEIYDVEK